MGASSEAYASRMRGPEPDEADQWVMEVARAVRAKHARREERVQRVMDALGLTHTMDDEEVFV